MEVTYTVVGTDGMQYGPISLDQIKVWIKEGRVVRETQVLRSDVNSWLPAAQYSELGLAAVPASAPASPMTAATAAAAAARASSAFPAMSNPALEKRLHIGANWFFWIAGLSLVNSALALTHSDRSFVIGLGVTQVIDAFAQNAGSSGTVLALGLDVIVAGIFIAFGFFARKQHLWSFIVGLVLYALDALLFVLEAFMGGGWLSLAFHAYAIFSIIRGAHALTQLKALERGAAVRPV